MLIHPRRLVHALLASACVVVGLAAAPAAAERKCVEEKFVNGQLQCTKYSDSDVPGNGSGNGSGNGEPAAPTCDLEGARGTDWSDKGRGPNFCIDDNVCFNTDVFVPMKMPEGKPPNEDSEAKITWCYDGIMGPASSVRFFWTGEDEPPSLLEQAQTAVAQLKITPPTVAVSPAGRTLVNLDTWFWLDGGQQEATAQAFTLVVTARFRSMTVDPGDGSAAFTCDYTTSAAQAEKNCLHEYRRASTRGSASVDGRPAYNATVTTVYDLTFTNGGDVITIPGAPTTYDGPSSSTSVRVDEVQTLTRPNR
jgi:hypothetical protein